MSKLQLQLILPHRAPDRNNKMYFIWSQDTLAKHTMEAKKEKAELEAKLEEKKKERVRNEQRFS